jgi:formate--tetrahydrofolate ligase
MLGDVTADSSPRLASVRTAVGPRPIAQVADDLGLRPDEVVPYGRWMAKVRIGALRRLASTSEGRLVLVTAMTPTPHGEGKTTTAIGLADGLARIGVRSLVALRQPTLGPVFGIKGGATGGGLSRLVPSQRIDLHLTGDAYAVGAAHNLAAAVIDNHLHHGNALGIDPATISWPRVTHHNDRALRRARIAIGDRIGERDASWEITSASEVMAILALSSGFADLRRRLGRIVVARRSDGRTVTLDDLDVAGAMAALLRDAIHPNLVQTAEGTPAFVHAGPFANIAHGTSSILADRLALRLADVVVTEAGFAAELGAEKFFDIACRVSGLTPSVVVVVATTRALELHGTGNLARHVAIVHAFGLPCVVAVNVFAGDTTAQLDAAAEAAREAGADAVAESRSVIDGGSGAVALARSVAEVAERDGGSGFRLLYPDELGLAAKIERIATAVYGADGVDLAPEAVAEIALLEADGAGTLPICVAKTPLSISHDPTVTGSPTGFRLPIRRVRRFAGAGFVTAYAGAIQTLPGLPAHPAAERIELDDEGHIIGL